MVKTRDLFEAIIDREGMFQAKMGTIKERNGMDLTEAEYIKNRLKEYIEELHKNDINDPDNHDGVITHLELDILKCEVKWAFRCIYFPFCPLHFASFLSSLCKAFSESHFSLLHFCFLGMVFLTASYTNLHP